MNSKMVVFHCLANPALFQEPDSFLYTNAADSFETP
jgi:hypothetical protein